MGFLKSTTEVCAHTPERAAAPRADACEGCGSTFNLRLCTSAGTSGVASRSRATTAVMRSRRGTR